MQSVFKIIPPALLLLVLLNACQKTIELPAPAEGQSKIALLGELIAGDTLRLRASRTWPLNSKPAIEFEREMQISLSDGSQTLALTPYQDELLQTLYTTLFSGPATVQPQTEYIVKASRPGLSPAEAIVNVPAAFNGNLSEEGLVLRDGDSMRSFRVGMSGLPTGSQYVVEVLRRPTHILISFRHDGYLYDYDQSRTLYDSLVNSGIPVPVLRDTVVLSGTDRQPFYSDRSSAENTDPGVPRAYYWLFVKPEGAASLNFRIVIPVHTPGTHWQYILRLKSVAADYYSFLKGYELRSLQPQTSGAEVLKPGDAQGNVKGGAGMIGGVYLREQRFVY